MAMRGEKTDPALADFTPGEGGPEEAAAYVADAVSELALLARRHGLHTLGFLLDMAQMEADEIVRFRQKPEGF